MPDPSRSVAATFEYEDDALILKQVTDNILIEWLHRESRASGCKAEARVTNWRLHRIAFQTSIIVPAGAEVSIAAGEMPVVLRGDHGARVDVFFAGIG